MLHATHVVLPHVAPIINTHLAHVSHSIGLESCIWLNMLDELYNSGQHRVLSTCSFLLLIEVLHPPVRVCGLYMVRSSLSSCV